MSRGQGSFQVQGVSFHELFHTPIVVTHMSIWAHSESQSEQCSLSHTKSRSSIRYTIQGHQGRFSQCPSHLSLLWTQSRPKVQPLHKTCSLVCNNSIPIHAQFFPGVNNLDCFAHATCSAGFHRACTLRMRTLSLPYCASARACAQLLLRPTHAHCYLLCMAASRFPLFLTVRMTRS